MKYRVHFFDKNGTETRSLVVDADNEETAELLAVKEADASQWPTSFKLADVEEIAT